MTDQQAYWNQRASLGKQAGTQDLIAAELERRAIARYVKDGMRVLDVGCGTGETVLRLARERRIEIVGLDNARQMIEAAKSAYYEHPPADSTVWFVNTDVETAEWGRPFDIIYSQRCIINLPDWPTQRKAIERIISWLRPGGLYLAVECSQDGLDGINELRARVGLPAIQPPFHNRYLRDDEVQALARDLRFTACLESVESPLSTYALLSRLVNARLAADAGVPPEYDSPINRLALELPDVGNLGQNRLWVWRRTSGRD